MKLVEIREYEVVPFFGAGEKSRVYEIYEGNWVKLRRLGNANETWHDAEMPRASDDLVVAMARYWLTSDGGFIGAFLNIEELDKFFSYYLRGKLIKKVGI